MVLRDGEYIKTLNTKDTDMEELIKLMVGRELSATYPARKNCIQDEVVLELKNICGNGDSNITFKLHKGEVLGFGGLIGAGRTELAQIIFGSAKKESGKIFFKNKEITPKSPREAIDIGIALVPEDRKRHGLLLQTSVKNNINMPIYKKISQMAVIKSKTEIKNANRYKEELLIKTPSLHQEVKNLSGGNQQKVVLAKWLAANSEVIIFDEPTRGIDVGAKYEIYKLINRLVESGKSVLLISSEMEELIGMSDRILVLAEGEITGALVKDEFDQTAIMKLAAGMEMGEFKI